MLEGNSTINKVVEPDVLAQFVYFFLSIEHSFLFIDHGHVYFNSFWVLNKIYHSKQYNIYF